MPINSKQKGKRGELEWAALSREEAGVHAERTVQYKGGRESFDVIWKDHWLKNWEVKYTQQLNVWKTMEQSREEAEGAPFALAWRKDRADWVVVVDAKHFFELIRRAP